MNKNIIKIIKEEIENFEAEESLEMPEKTDPTKGVVAPSKKVLSDVCEKEKFCKKQGPITFGQLRTLVESAQKKNLTFDIGEGGYKATLRLLPWFFPQIAVAGFIGSSIRAFNKIIRPGLEDTRGYKKWWGRTMMKVMDVFEGDIPRQDPISKIFFISDGLLHMMDKKFKLKFARYIAELAASKPDSEPVPEYFVENELRKWINQKFLLNPPLQPKTITESEDDFDWIRETQPVSYEFLIGKALEFEPPIKDGDTLISILTFLSNLGFEHGDWYLDMEWGYGEYTEIFGLYLNHNGRIIYTADLWGEDYKEHISSYAEEEVEVLDGWDILSGYINKGTITESEDDFDWVRDVEIKTDLTPAQIYNRYEVFPVEVVGPYIAGQYRDIEYRDGKLYFITDGWCDLARLFEDNSGGYNYMNRYLAKAVLCDDDYWEPYSASDLIGREWKSNVWGIVTDIPEALKHVKEYIKKNYVVPVGYNPNQLNMFGEKTKELDIHEIDGRVLDTDFYNEIIQDNDYLGDLIDDDGIFQDLKSELGWAYASSYNTAVSDGIYNTATDSIIDLLGKPTWEASNLVFECTDLILNTVENLISSCWSANRKYYDPERHKEEDQTDEEAFEEFAEECVDKPFDIHSWFVDVFVEFLEENDDELNPRYDDYPSDSEIKTYFLDDLYGRI
jgi:hypothetical protein